MRKNHINIVFIVLVVISTLFFQSCATILGGKKNTFVVKDACPQNIMVYLDGNFIGEGPGKIKLDKDEIQHGSLLELKAEGFESQQYLILRRINAVYSIVDICTGGIGFGVDLARGNIYRPKPRVFTCTLNEFVKKPGK
ncbi:MAG: hypothetical protein QNK30_07685 [Bacteroidales bacterium]|nr:hypothetical protein [Bacteroidales bacterium]